MGGATVNLLLIPRVRALGNWIEAAEKEAEMKAEDEDEEVIRKRKGQLKSASQLRKLITVLLSSQDLHSKSKLSFLFTYIKGNVILEKFQSNHCKK